MTLHTISTQIGGHTFYVREMTDARGLFHLLTKKETQATYFPDLITAHIAISRCQDVFEGIEFEIKEEKR